VESPLEFLNWLVSESWF